MSAALRDQRIRIFSFADTSSDGRASSGYTYVTEKWGRIDPASARETTVAQQAEQKVDAVVTLPLIGVNVVPGSLVKGEGRYYKVTHILPRRMANEQEVFAVYADDAGTFNITGEPA